MYEKYFYPTKETLVQVICPEENYTEKDIQKFNRQLDILDRFTFTMELHSIIIEDANDYLQSNCKNNSEFITITKYLLNYLNAVYIFKDYINNLKGDCKKISDNYYFSNNWYRFICDYRNRVTHQFKIAKEYDPHLGNIYLNLDELIESQIKLKTHKKSQEENKKRFLEQLDTLRSSALVVNNMHYINMKKVIFNATIEIRDMFNKILLSEYENKTTSALKTIFSFIYLENNERKRTVLVDPETENSIYFNEVLENFIYNSGNKLGINHPIFTKIKNLYLEHNYYYLFNYNCTINELEEILGYENQ